MARLQRPQSASINDEVIPSESTSSFIGVLHRLDVGEEASPPVGRRRVLSAQLYAISVQQFEVKREAVDVPDGLVQRRHPEAQHPDQQSLLLQQSQHRG
jgi:hypothetical protein